MMAAAWAFWGLLFWQGSGLFGLNLRNIIIFVFVLIVVHTIYRLIRGSREKKKRQTDLQAFAASGGWTFTPHAAAENFHNWRSYSILNHGWDEISGMLERGNDGGNAFVFDYRYRERRGKHIRYYTQTIAGFYSLHLNLPFFALAEETIGSRLGEVFGYKDIDFSSHPGFSKKFNLAGHDELQIRQTFDPRILSFLENLPGIQIDGGGNYIFIYYHARTVPVENLNAFLGTAQNIYNLFRR
jgi:hypothetical protein